MSVHCTITVSLYWKCFSMTMRLCTKQTPYRHSLTKFKVEKHGKRPDLNLFEHF